MGFWGEFSPAQIAQLDQERQHVKKALSDAVGTVRREYIDSDEVTVDETFVLLMRQFAKADHTKILALFTESLIRLACLKEEK